MRLRCFLVLICVPIVFLITSIDASRAKVPRSPFSSGNDVHKAAERFLRVSHATDKDEDEERAGGGLSVPFVEKVKTLVTPLVVTPDIIRRWLKKEKSATLAFQRMHLQDAGDDLFLNEQFFKWVSYVDELKVVTKNENINPISTLAAKYGDDSLYKLIEKARESTNVKTKEMATHLQAEQMRYWIDTRKDPSDVFHLFQPKIVSSQDLFSNPEFRSWVKYVDDLNAKYPEHTVSMAPALRKYATDGDLLQLTLKAKKIDATKSIAKRVEDDVLQFWLTSRKTPDEALVGLKLDKLYSLENPIWSTWTKYLNKFNKRYPDKATTTIDTLTRRFGDKEVATFLIASKAKDATKERATELESELFQMWLRNGESVQKVFVKLELHEADLYRTQLLKTWVSYMDTVATNDRGKIPKIFATLKKDYEKNPGPLLHILDTAMKYPSMEKAATELRDRTLTGIVALWKSHGEVFKLLGLHKVPESHVQMVDAICEEYGERKFDLNHDLNGMAPNHEGRRSEMQRQSATTTTTLIVPGNTSLHKKALKG